MNPGRWGSTVCSHVFTLLSIIDDEAVVQLMVLMVSQSWREMLSIVTPVKDLI